MAMLKAGSRRYWTMKTKSLIVFLRFMAGVSSACPPFYSSETAAGVGAVACLVARYSTYPMPRALSAGIESRL